MKTQTKEKLELKHLACYLPYGLELQCPVEHNGIMTTDRWGMTVDNIDIVIPSNFKPILRPLSDLTKEIEHNGVKLIPVKNISKDVLFLNKGDNYADYFLISENPLLFQSYEITEYLFSLHFDVFGLIGKGLADRY